MLLNARPPAVGVLSSSANAANDCDSSRGGGGYLPNYKNFCMPTPLETAQHQTLCSALSWFMSTHVRALTRRAPEAQGSGTKRQRFSVRISNSNWRPAEHVERDLVLVSRQWCPVAAISLTHLSAACALYMYSTVVLFALVTLGWRRRTGRAAGVTWLDWTEPVLLLHGIVCIPSPHSMSH